MNRAATVLTTGLVLLLNAAPALASWTWMHNAALNEYSDGDWEILKAEARRVLVEEDDGTSVDWSNPETGSGGSIKVLATMQFQGRTCRRAAFRQFTASGRKGQGAYYVCHQEDDTWKFVAESSIRAAQSDTPLAAPDA
jgi:surface antigen